MVIWLYTALGWHVNSELILLHTLVNILYFFCEVYLFDCVKGNFLLCFTFWHPCGSCLWGNLQIYPVYWLLISCKDKFICFCIKLLYYLLLHYLKIKILIFFFAFDHLSDYGLLTTPRIFGIDLAWTMFFFTQEQTRAKQSSANLCKLFDDRFSIWNVILWQ